MGRQGLAYPPPLTLLVQCHSHTYLFFFFSFPLSSSYGSHIAQIYHLWAWFVLEYALRACQAAHSMFFGWSSGMDQLQVKYFYGIGQPSSNSSKIEMTSCFRHAISRSSLSSSKGAFVKTIPDLPFFLFFFLFSFFFPILSHQTNSVRCTIPPTYFRMDNCHKATST